MWVKHLKAFLPIYKALEESKYTKSKVYKPNYQRTKLFLYMTSELGYIQILVRLYELTREGGPLDLMSI